MSDLILAAYSLAGAPLAGLTPTWAAFVNASTGVAATQPTITALGSGLYKIVGPAPLCCGVLDLGATASPRYVLVSTSNEAVLLAVGLDGTLLTGLTPTWSTYRNRVTGSAITPEATFTHLGSGMYRVNSPAADAVGIVDLGATANGRYPLLGQSDAIAADLLPDVAVAAHLAAQLGGGWAVGTNIFRGPVRPFGAGIPLHAIFCEATGGPVNQPYLGTATDWRVKTVMVHVRGNPLERHVAQDVAVQCLEALHRASLTGYTYSLVRESFPTALGQLEDGSWRFVLNVQLGIAE